MGEQVRQAFIPNQALVTTVPKRSSLLPSKCNPRCSCRPSRRHFLRTALLLPASIAATSITNAPATLAADKLSKLENAVVPVLMCRKIMKPVRRYITEGAWDKGRTNVNYCTRVLALRSRMRDAAEQMNGDDFYDAMDIMGEMTNTMSQLDASLYTPLFIASDEGISVEQRKYQQQAFAYYEDALQFLEDFLSKVPQVSLEKAQSVAATAQYEIKFEDE